MKKTKIKKYGLHLYFIIVFLLSLAGIAVLFSVVSALLYHFFHLSLELPTLVSCIIMSDILAGVVTVLLSRKIFSPITALSRVMNEVAHGDFAVRLEQDSDVEEINDLYKNFNLMVTELSATETLQTDFVSNVSHEFKTPINAIEGYTMLLQGDGSLSEEQTEYAEKILFNTKRLSGLVSNILLLSKIDNQAIPSKRERFRLDEQIRQAIVFLEPRWLEKDIEFEADLDEISYLGNEQLLMHVWTNLIENAVKFTPPGGSIIINLKFSEQNVLVSVQDSGSGIADENKNRIFDKFYQADSSHKNEGNGLGLALAKQIVALHKGHIEVENCKPSGCKFTVILPITAD